VVEDLVSIDGTWNVSINSPMGKQKGVLELRTEGDKLFGTGKAMGNTMEVLDGAVDGDNVTFAMEINRPMTMRMEFKLAVTGDTIAGEVKAGMLGKQKVSGERA
jgi:hypothetical protein